MVLHPLDEGDASAGLSEPRHAIPAWQAVEKTQKQSSKEWVLISQVDHAQLAGDLAARLQSALFPQLSSDVLKAIALHDAGWATFDDCGNGDASEYHPKINDNGRPLSFLDVKPAEFIIAWTGSIVEAQRVSNAAGYLVSRHFSRLAEGRLTSRIDDEEDTSRLRQFLHQERERQKRISTSSRLSVAELETLTDVLQFCDLLSLYLCCGSNQPVEFPQAFDGIHVKVRWDQKMFRCDPAVFGSGASLGICGRSYGIRQGSSHDLAFLIR